MSKIQRVEISDEEQKRHGMAGVRAAYQELNKVARDMEAINGDYSVIVKAILRAYAAAKGALRDEEKAIMQTKPENGHGWFECAPDDAVATAYFLLQAGLDIDDQTEPRCMGGGQYIIFAQAFAAIHAAHQAQFLMEDDEPFSFWNPSENILD